MAQPHCSQCASPHLKRTGVRGIKQCHDCGSYVDLRVNLKSRLAQLWPSQKTPHQQTSAEGYGGSNAVGNLRS